MLLVPHTPNPKRRPETSGTNPAAEDPRADGPYDDTLSRALSAEERAKLSMDSWEPSLLRCLLDAEGRLDRGSES